MTGIKSSRLTGRNSLYLLCKPTRHRQVHPASFHHVSIFFLPLSSSSAQDEQPNAPLSPLHSPTCQLAIFPSLFPSFSSCAAALLSRYLPAVEMRSVSDTNQPPLTVAGATAQQHWCGEGERKEERQERKDAFVSVSSRLDFNGVIKWLETDWNNKNRAWRREGSGGWGQTLLLSRTPTLWNPSKLCLIGSWWEQTCRRGGAATQQLRELLDEALSFFFIIRYIYRQHSCFRHIHTYTLTHCRGLISFIFRLSVHRNVTIQIILSCAGCHITWPQEPFVVHLCLFSRPEWDAPLSMLPLKQ